MGRLYHSKLLNSQMAQLHSYWGWAVFETLFHCIWLMLRTGSTLHVWWSYPIYIYIYTYIYIYPCVYIYSTHILFIWFSMFFPYWMIIPNKDWMMLFPPETQFFGPWGWVYLFMVQSSRINSTSIYQHSPQKIQHFHVLLHVKIVVSQCFPCEKSSKSSPSRSGEAVGSFQGLLIHQPEPGRSNEKPRRTWGYQYPLN